MRCKAPCTDEVFVVAWEGSSSLAQVAEVCGYPNPRVASNRAARLRRRGVLLRPFMRGGASGHRGGRKPKLNYLARRAREEHP